MIRLGKYDEALKISNDLISQNSSDEQALANKGEALIKKSQFNDAIIILQNSISIDSTFDEAWILLAKAQAHQKILYAPNRLQGFCQFDKLLSQKSATSYYLKQKKY